MASRGFLLLALVAAVVWAACSIYDTSLLLPANDAGADPDAGPDGPADLCPHARAPSRPTTEDGTGEIEVTTAVRTLDMGLAKDGGTPSGLSFDLDGICTCPGPESCKPRVVGVQHCDDDAGRDNSGGDLVRRFSIVSAGALSQESINARINDGDYGLVIRVSGYNGKANDKQVVVAVFISNGTPNVPADAGSKKPKWDGTDSWTLDSASVLGGANGERVIPNFVDTNAYVANGVMVASLDFPLSLGNSNSDGTLTLELTGSVITAKLVPERGSYKIEKGQIAGRWAVRKLLAALAALFDPSRPGEHICPGTQSYDDVKALICRGADILGDPLKSDPATPCDALSIGFGFTAYPAKIGPVVQAPAGPPNCPDSGKADDCQ
jgi:hypothetical protein